MAMAIVVLTAGYEVNLTSHWGTLSIRDAAGTHTRFKTLHRFLKLYTQVILFSTMPALPILSASVRHLEHLPWKTPCPPQPKVAYLSSGPRGCPGNKDVVLDATGEIIWGLPSITSPCLHEQVAPSAGASCWYWYPCQYHPFILEQQCRVGKQKQLYYSFLIKVGRPTDLIHAFWENTAICTKDNTCIFSQPAELQCCT